MTLTKANPIQYPLPLSPSIALTLPSSIHTVADLLTPDECTTLTSTYNNLVPSNVTPETIRDRETFTDPELAEKLWERLKAFYGGERIEDDEGSFWVAEGLNERFRLCRYLKGGKFSPHFDGTYTASVNQQSFTAVNIYANTVPLANKGATRILKRGSASGSDEVLAQVQPELGTALIFRHDIWHDGEELTDGVKFLLRTDIMYSREKEFDFDKMGEAKGWTDEEKGRRALKIAERLEDSGQSEEAVRWYKRAFRWWPNLEGGEPS